MPKNASMTMNRIAASGEIGIIADMARTHIRFRTWAALIVLGGLIVVFAMAGNWQLHRAAQRDAIADSIAVAASQSPLPLSAVTDAKELTPWRQATAQGEWLHRYTVLLENRNYQGRPGYWVATPFVLDQSESQPDESESGPGESVSSNGDPANRSDFSQARTVVVLRGWLARDLVMQQSNGGMPHIDPDLADKLVGLAEESNGSAQHAIQGEIFPHVPRALELWSWSDDDTQLPARLDDTRTQLPAIQNLDLNDYARATGLRLLPVVLAQTNTPADTTLVRDWAHPSSDADTNRGYALQWFSFCAIAVGAWLYVFWSGVLRQRTRRSRRSTQP